MIMVVPMEAEVPIYWPEMPEQGEEEVVVDQAAVVPSRRIGTGTRTLAPSASTAARSGIGRTRVPTPPRSRRAICAATSPWPMAPHRAPMIPGAAPSRPSASIAVCLATWPGTVLRIEVVEAAVRLLPDGWCAADAIEAAIIGGSAGRMSSGYRSMRRSARSPAAAGGDTLPAGRWAGSSVCGVPTASIAAGRDITA